MANEFKIKNGLILGPLPSQPVISIQDTSASIVADASSILVTGKAIYDYVRPFATNSSVGLALVPFATNASIGTAAFAKNASLGLYVQKAGDTMTGTLQINSNLGVTGNITKVKFATNTINNYQYDGIPTLEFMSLIPAAINNKLRFIPAFLQEESTDGSTWITSTRASANQLADIMIGEGQTQSFYVIPNSSIGVSGYYRLTWDATQVGGDAILNALYIYNNTEGNIVNIKIDRFDNPTSTWVDIVNGNVNNWPGLTYIPHTTFRLNGGYPGWGEGWSQKARITFSKTSVNPAGGFQLWAIEWFGGYPPGKRNVESYDRDKNVTFPGVINSWIDGNSTIWNAKLDSTALYPYATNTSVGLAIQNFSTNASVNTALGYFIKSASLGSDFVWVAGLLDVSIATGVSSLASLSDVSITDISSNQFLQYDFEISKWKNVSAIDVSLYFWELSTALLREASIGTGLTWNAGMLDVSASTISDASINFLYDWDLSQDASIIRIDVSLNDTVDALSVFLPNASIGTGFAWVAGMLDVSVATITSDTSILASRVFYDPLTLDPALAMPSAVGGISAGTTVADLSGNNVTVILNDLLFPTVQPTLNAPYGTFTMSPTTTLYEVSTNISSLQFTTTFNQGSIYNGATYQNVRSGSCNNYDYTGSNLVDASSNTSPNIQSFSYDVQYASQSWSCQIGYNQGPQPLNNKGGNATTGPLAAGALTAASTRSIEGSYPYYATTTDINTLTKQTLLALATTPIPNTGNGFILAGETGDIPDVIKQKFEIPSARLSLHALTGIKTYSTVSEAWAYEGGSAASSLTTWTVSASTNTIQGYITNYSLYTYAGTKRDSTKIYLEF